ncbi:MAG: hypothetical protein PHS04_11155 [Tissierellia bacterium]|nr:hypothetical protein [Tissierellia bacterium]
MRQIARSKKYLGYEYAVMFYSSEWSDPSDWYCGYVKIPKNNNFYGLGYWRNMPYLGYENETIESYFDVHCGITFAGRISELNNDWFLGFDCARAGDNPITQDANYAERECKKLIDQIVALEKGENHDF